MPIYLLKRLDTVDFEENVSMVVRALDEKDARRVAANARAFEKESSWLDFDKSTCERLIDVGESCVFLVDFARG